MISTRTTLCVLLFDRRVRWRRSSSWSRTEVLWFAGEAPADRVQQFILLLPVLVVSKGGSVVFPRGEVFPRN